VLAARPPHQEYSNSVDPVDFDALRLFGKISFEYPYQGALAPGFDHSCGVGLRESDEYSATIEALKTFTSAAENHSSE